MARNGDLKPHRQLGLRLDRELEAALMASAERNERENFLAVRTIFLSSRSNSEKNDSREPHPKSAESERGEGCEAQLRARPCLAHPHPTPPQLLRR